MEPRPGGLRWRYARLMRVGDLIGVTLMGLVLLAIGTGVAFTVEDDGLAVVGVVIACVGGLALLGGLVATAVYAGVRAGRRE